jgi:hypothetical protein
MFKKMKVSGITNDPLTNTPIVILKNEDDKKVLPIWIGLLEANAIVSVLDKIQFSRPMTHDLIKNILAGLGVSVSRIEINDLVNNVFYATIHFVMDGKDILVDARPSDAIALALRTDSPIYVREEVIEKSRKIDLTQKEEGKEKSEPQKWEEILESMEPEDFGKYKM